MTKTRRRLLKRAGIDADTGRSSITDNRLITKTVSTHRGRTLRDKDAKPAAAAAAVVSVAVGWSLRPKGRRVIRQLSAEPLLPAPRSPWPSGETMIIPSRRARPGPCAARARLRRVPIRQRANR